MKMRISRSFWIFRTNLKNLEYYHNYKDLSTFKDNTHDFYLLQGLWFLENNIFDDVIVWRLSPKQGYENIIFDINGKKFTQKFVNDFSDCFKEKNKPIITYFRGGFREYDQLIIKNKKFFGISLYLGAGKRIYPQYGGKYDKILIEDERDNHEKLNCIPFYKTTNYNIFKPLDLNPIYDMCIISNFSQIKYKGTKKLIQEIANNKFLKKLKICHIGNNKEIGIEICKKNNVTNIEFLGYLTRNEINDILNKSKISIINSNRDDGCPRVITEIITSGTVLLINEETRLLKYYRETPGVITFNNLNFLEKIKYSIENYKNLKDQLLQNINKFNIDIICEKNLNLWL